jgi:N-acyl-phosphatidylethanolamine-hydrolysing phospholipase D
MKISRTTRFSNPDASPALQKHWRQWAAFWWRMNGPRPPRASHALAQHHPVAEPEALRLFRALQATDTLTWLGHSSFLIRLDGKVVLTDPYLTEYASPIVGAGPRRYAGPGMSVERLPQIDLLVISHNHYDHLDRRTLARLPGRERIPVVVPSGVGRSLRDLGFKEVREIAWGETTEVDSLTVTAVPAIHFSGRGLFDRNKSLWAGFIVSRSNAKVYFAGDTAYHPSVFKRIRQDFGRMDVALVPIGGYEPRNLMRDVHVNPEEAIAIAQDVGAKTLVAMHWGTIRMTTEPPGEPPLRFRAAGKAAGYDDDALWAMRIGETRRLSQSPDAFRLQV